jgi:hypothetical protein
MPLSNVSEFGFELGGVDGVTLVVTGAVLDEMDQAPAGTGLLVGHVPIEQVADRLHHR